MGVSKSEASKRTLGPSIIMPKYRVPRYRMHSFPRPRCFGLAKVTNIERSSRPLAGEGVGQRAINSSSPSTSSFDRENCSTTKDYATGGETESGQRELVKSV